MVSITYDAPTADESASALSFGTQALGTAGAVQMLTVTNDGSAPLIVSGVLVGGLDPGDYLVDDGCQQPVAPSLSCGVGVRFGPQAPGASSAMLSLLSNAASGASVVTLSGTAGSLPQGPLGPTGSWGATGSQGPAGPAGRIELVSCKSVTKLVKGHRRAVQQCTTKLVSGTVKFTATGSVMHATISRRGVRYAAGTSIATASGGLRLVLSDQRPLRRGRYLLTLHGRHDGRSITHRTSITIT
jgi:hypothetical protein